MKISVQPDCARSVPSGSAKLSTVRQEVVPTQMTRPPARLRLVDDARRFLRNDAKLRVHRMIFDLILLDRTERAKTDVQRDIAEPYAHVAICCRSSFVKCRPAVGAAALPSSRE